MNSVVNLSKLNCRSVQNQMLARNMGKKIDEENKISSQLLKPGDQGDCCTTKPKGKRTHSIDDCCMLICRDKEAHLDYLHYSPQNHSNRIYEQTWVDCPEVTTISKEIFCAQNSNMTDIPKRCEHEKHANADAKDSSLENDNKTLLLFKDTKEISSEKGTETNTPTYCDAYKVPQHCEKMSAPFPNYSEYNKSDSPKHNSKECNCVDMPDLCDLKIFDQLIKKSKK